MQVFFFFEKERGVDRIKRSVLKNDCDIGGLNIITDVDCLNKALKLRQYIRAGKSSHPISSIQRFCMEELGHTSCMEREYDKITNREEITMLQVLNHLMRWK